MTRAPDRLVPSADGTPIALYVSGRRPGGAPTLLLVHGATADHTAWRTAAPLLEERFAVASIDRRGRGGSGDAARYSITLEYDDVAAVSEALAAESGAPIVVVGHSYGGRVALGGALRSSAIGRVVCYEGAPPAPGAAFESATVVEELEALRAAGRDEELLVTFFRDVVGMPANELDAYRSNPVWPARVAAAATVPREVRASRGAEAGLDAVSGVAVPVLQVLGSTSRPAFAAAARALDARLRDGRIEVIDGAAHAAHHSHPEAFVKAVTRFAEDA